MPIIINIFLYFIFIIYLILLIIINAYYRGSEKKRNLIPFHF